MYPAGEDLLSRDITLNCMGWRSLRIPCFFFFLYLHVICIYVWEFGGFDLLSLYWSFFFCLILH